MEAVTVAAAMVPHSDRLSMYGTVLMVSMSLSELLKESKMGALRNSLSWPHVPGKASGRGA